MNEIDRSKFLRRYFGKTGWVLLLYYGILNVSVFAVTIADAIYHFLQSEGKDMTQELLERINGNAWGYFIAAAIGLFLLCMWKGKAFWKNQIWIAERPAGIIDILGLAGLMTFGQVVFQLLANVIEFILNLFGFSALSAIESASMIPDTFSMFLYAGVLAPITEELLFRGLILRTLLPGGKKFAILTSAFLFGVFHGNIVQTPFAFLMGLIFGYTAVEFSIGWSMALHMFNNLILSEVLSRVIAKFPESIGNAVYWIVILSLSLAGILTAMCKRREIKAFINEGRISRLNLKCFFCAPGVIVFTVLLCLSMIFTIMPL